MPTASETASGDDDRQEAGDRDQRVQDPEDAAPDLLGDDLLELGLGGDRDRRVGDAGDERDRHDHGEDRDEGRRVHHRLGGADALEQLADRVRDRDQDEAGPQRDQADLDGQAARDHGSDHVHEEHAGDDAEPERKHDDDEVLGGQVQHVDGEAGPQGAQDADDRRGHPEVGQRPRDRRVRPDVGDPLPELADHGADRRLRLVEGVATGGQRKRRSRRQGPAERRGDQVQDRHHADQERRTGDRDHQRPEERVPDRERGIERQREDPVRCRQLAARHNQRDDAELGRREERRRDRDHEREQEDDADVGASEREEEEEARTHEARRHQHEPAVESVHVDAGKRAEDDGRRKEADQQDGHGAVRPGRREDQHGQAVQDHVAAHLGRHLREPDDQERPVPEDRECRGRSLRRVGAPVHAAPSSGPRRSKATSRRSTWRRSTRTLRPQVVQRSPRSAPRRSTSQVRPPHGCGRRSSIRSPRRNGTGAFTG